MTRDEFWFKQGFLDGVLNESPYCFFDLHPGYPKAYFWGKLYGFLFESSEEKINEILLTGV